jgi:hypothetical protein
MVSNPPRGGGTQAPAQFSLQQMRGSFAWGGSPATATVVYAGFAGPLNGVGVGAGVRLNIGAHYFSGICKSDTAMSGTRGQMRTLEFADLRDFLQWDYVFGAFNLADIRLVGGVRLKRWKHMYPGNYGTYTWTFTNAPLMGWQILQAIFNGNGSPTGGAGAIGGNIGAAWVWDLTSNGLFPGGLLNWPIYDLDCLNGIRLDALLNTICDKSGLVFCHDPLETEYTNTDWRLVFTRKGYGLLPMPFPVNSDNQRVGVSLSGHATNICVVGERNKYQVLGVPMVKDWVAAWEQFLDVDLLAQDIFNNEKNPLGDPTASPPSTTPTAYNAYANDPEQWIGAGDAKVRAQEITVSEYVAMRNARAAADGAQFAETRKYAGRWRMDMPAALYLEHIVFKAFKPDPTQFAGVTNKAGLVVPLASADIADELLCRVYYDPVAGTMTADTTQPVDGNGVLIAKGYQVGEDLFRLVQPQRMNVNFFSANNRLWASVNFQIDDSGEGIRFVIAENPVFTSENLLASVDNNVVLNAQFTLETPPVSAALVFECERYTYWEAANPNMGRMRVENVGGLMQEWLVDQSDDYTEITYANSQTADQTAKLIADSLLLNQYAYAAGGYELKWNPAQLQQNFGTMLAPPDSSCIDRLEISVGPGGVMEVVDFTTERQRDHFEPERELERRTTQNSLFPGQMELRQDAQDQRRLNAAIRKLPPTLFTLFQKLLKGEVDGNLLYTQFIPGANAPATLPIGTPVFSNPNNGGKGSATAPAAVVYGTDSKFVGVTVRHNEPANWQFPVQSSGEALARVQGPVNVNDPIGPSPNGGTDFAVNGAYLVKNGTPPVGIALQALSGSSVTTIAVRLGAGGSGNSGGGGGNVWL